MDNSQNSQGLLRKNAVGLSHIVFFVIAAAAPLTAVVGASPAAFAFGNGPGVPSAFVISGIIYLLFSVGFAAMSRHITNAGAFYSYIAHGLGRPLGIGGALIALLTYNSTQIAVYGMIGFFLNEAVKVHWGVDVPWWLFAFLLQVLVYFCGVRKIDFSGKILGVVMACELGVLLVLNIAILIHGGGPHGISFTSFHPSVAFSPGLGISLVFVIAAFIGFEATAIFSEEARDPKRTVAIATYVSVTIITVCYAFSSWAIVQAYGDDAIKAAALSDPGNLYFLISTRLIGAGWTNVMNVLLITSMLASILALHNTITRYFFALGREGLLWKNLAKTHPVHQSPFVAGMIQSLIAFLAVAAFAIARQHPFNVVLSWGSALGVIGMLTLQIMVAVAIMVFFYRNKVDDRKWNTLIAPGLSVIGLAVCLFLVIHNLPLMSGSNSPIVNGFPFLVLLTGALGIAVAMLLKWQNPALYDSLGRLIDEV